VIQSPLPKRQSRFLVATVSALYLTKKTKFGKSLKIADIFPWVRLTSAKFSLPDLMSLNFGTSSINSHFESISNASFILSQFFSAFFPENYRLIFETIFSPQSSEIQSSKHYLPAVYVSFCHSLEIPINDVLFSFLSRDDNNRLDLTKIEIDSRTAMAVLPTLSFTRTFRTIRINGSQFPQTFRSIAGILNANPFITGLSLNGADSMKYFDEFIHGLDHSGVIRLSFIDISLGDGRLEMLIGSSRMPQLQTLVLDKCKVPVTKFTEPPERLNSLCQLTIRNNKDIFKRSVVRKVLKLCCEHSIAKLELS
jgi:hypothetical protein